MEIYLVRHTTPDIEKGTCYGQADIDVAPDTYEEEKKAVLNSLPESADVIYSSPLTRCFKLATDIRNTLYLKQKIYRDPNLMELNFGQWENQPWNSLNQEQLSKWMKNFVHAPAPDGESFQMLYDRTMTFIDHLSIQKYKTAIVVTHGGVIRSFISYMNHSPLASAFTYQVPYGSVMKFTI